MTASLQKIELNFHTISSLEETSLEKDQNRFFNHSSPIDNRYISSADRSKLE